MERKEIIDVREIVNAKKDATSVSYRVEIN